MSFVKSLLLTTSAVYCLGVAEGASNIEVAQDVPHEFASPTKDEDLLEEIKDFVIA